MWWFRIKKRYFPQMRPAQGTVYWMLSKNFQPKKSNQKTKMLKKSSIHLQGAFLTVLPWKWLSASQIGKSQNYSSKKKTKNEKSLSIRTVPICSSPQNDQGKSSSNPTPLVIDLGNWDFINRLTKCSACGTLTDTRGRDVRIHMCHSLCSDTLFFSCT